MVLGDEAFGKWFWHRVRIFITGIKVPKRSFHNGKDTRRHRQRTRKWTPTYNELANALVYFQPPELLETHFCYLATVFSHRSLSRLRQCPGTFCTIHRSHAGCLLCLQFLITSHHLANSCKRTNPFLAPKTPEGGPADRRGRDHAEDNKRVCDVKSISTFLF